MRTVNPDDLEQLAKILDGRGGVQDKIDEAFSRASRLGVSSNLSALKPLRSWVTETAPDLRKRASIARLENGDPEAGLRWAGFSDEELKKYSGEGLSPDHLLLANSVAASDDPAAESLRRGDNESIDAWIERLEVTALTKIPLLRPHKETVESFVGAYREFTGFTEGTGRITVLTTSMMTILVGNRIRTAWRNGGWTKPIQNYVYQSLRGSGNRDLVRIGRGVKAWSPTLKSLSAPGAWLPTRLAGFLYRSPRFQQMSQIPGVPTLQAWANNRGWNAVSGSRFMNMGPNSIIQFIGGNTELANAFGGTTHAGVAAKASSASLFKVTGNAYAFARDSQGLGRGASVARGLATAGKVAGAFRGFGVVSGVASTAISANTVYHNGWPWDKGNFATREKGAAYVADVAETGFNAALTAAIVAPNPITIGATIAFGAVYVGAKVVQHWDGIKEGGYKAASTVGNAAKEAVTNPLGTAKEVGHALNPKNWF
ncbi:PE-PGRS family protein [Streptomyces sp. DSM 41014]|uniref:PE-PGRS family protein n=1 Tax=Streptomyces hintoniae TaxID=3075521 RepID=A0ABU2UUK1_9ACTN|nr:PE-PGRS family protein [Streptomyces sp. DSM 41014]MDT0476972.1 PE-PGRS family protein [Streptomyces sp. DSM 41014]